MRRELLKIGQQYACFSNKGRYNGNPYRYFSEGGLDWNRSIVEIVDNGYYPAERWGNSDLTDAEAAEKRYADVDADIATYQKRSNSGVLVRMIVDGNAWREDTKNTLRIIRADSIREPVSIYKRHSVRTVVAGMAYRKEEALKKMRADAKGRRWNKTEGKHIRNQLKKVERKYGVALHADRNKIHRPSNLVQSDNVTISYDNFKELLEKV